MTTKPSHEELERPVQELERDYSQLKNKLLESRSFAEEIMTYMTEGLVLTDTQGTVIFINQRLSEMFGYLPEEIIGKCWLDLVPADQKTIAKKAEARRSQGHTDRYEIVLHRKNGERIQVLIGAGPRFEKKDGQYIGSMGVVTDITDRKRMEKALRENEEKYRILFEHTGEALFVAQDEKIVFQNPKSLEISGYSAEEFQSKPFFNFIHEDDREMVMDNHLRRLRNEKLPERYAFRIIHKNGSILWVELNAVLIQWNEKPAILCFMTDITERKQVENALSQSEKKLQATLDATPFPVAVVDLNDDKISYWSRSALELFGHTASIASEWYQIAYPDPDYRREVIERWKPFLKTARESGKPVNTGEYQVTCKDGSIRTCELYATFLLDNLIVTFNDITERKQAEDGLRVSNLRYRILVETTTDWVWSINLEGHHIFTNPAVESILGYTPQEIIGTSSYPLIAPEDESMVHTLLSESVQLHSGWRSVPIRWLHKDGSIKYMESSAQPVFDTNGNLTGFSGIDRDITERKRAEALLKESETRYKLLSDATFEAIFISEKGICISQNNTAARMFGYTETETSGRMATDWIHPDDRNLVKKNMLSGFEDPYEVKALHRDGSAFYCSIQGRNFIHEGKNLRITALRDISNNKQAEVEREKLQAQLNQAQKMESVGRLAGGVAHDFNNMLGVILGHTELALLRTDDKHKLCSDLNEIQKAAKRSADITKQLLAFARKQTISPRQLDLNDTVESMLNMLRRLIGEDIDLVWQPSPHLWPVKIDPSQIDQILANLCVNARDAIDGVGKLTIVTGRKTFDEEYCKEHLGFIPGDFVLLAVSDNGCGMDKDTLENLFEPFFTTKDIGKGTGLGLATIYGIVKQNNGFINVYSEPGQGSTFNIYLPRLVAGEDIDKAVPEKKAAAGGTETILLVEDEPTILRMTRMMLERKGYSVLSAATPADAMEKAKNHSGTIDLLMSDVVMPEMNGRDLAGKITVLYPDIRLLFMSGYTANVIAHHGVLDDGVAFIQKPFSMADMTAKVREVLDKTSDETQV
jgi:PAS domain S-box-containing protein